MNLSIDDTKSYCNQISSLSQSDDVHIMLSPSFIHMHIVSEYIKNRSNLSLCAQDCSAFKNGAHTSDISAKMLKEYSCKYVIIGHSERRESYHEKEDLLSEKIDRAYEEGLTPIYCIGEDFDARQEDKVLHRLRQQLRDVGLNRLIATKAIIAYEPIWSIGTGITPTNDQIADVARFISDMLPGHDIVYGGSVGVDNAKEISSIQNINGLLIGKASCDITTFGKLIESVISK